MTLKHSILGLALIVSLPATEGNAQRRGAEGTFDRTLNVSGAVSLDVSTGSGSITVRQGSAGRVEIHARVQVGIDRRRSEQEAAELVRLIESNPPIQQNGNTIRIGRLIEGRDFDRNVSISYEIVVPEQSSVEANSGSGGQVISGLTGSIEASTGSGRIVVSNIRGNVTAHTGSGSIRAEGIGGSFSGTTGSGEVTLAQVAPGDVDISTGSGTVRVNGVKGALSINTGSGGITAQGEQAGRWQLKTSSGSVTVQLPQNAGFELSAHTSSGGVYVDHPFTVQGRIDKRRNDVSGRVRGGGHALDVQTSSGTIRIQ